MDGELIFGIVFLLVGLLYLYWAINFDITNDIPTAGEPSKKQRKRKLLVGGAGSTIIGILIILKHLLILFPQENVEKINDKIIENSFRYLFETFPYKNDDNVYCIFLGEDIKPIEPKYLEKFKDFNKKVLSFSDGVAINTSNSKVHFFLDDRKFKINIPVAVFQIIPIHNSTGGIDEIEATLFYEDIIKRKIFKVEINPEGTVNFEIIKTGFH